MKMWDAKEYILYNINHIKVYGGRDKRSYIKVLTDGDDPHVYQLTNGQTKHGIATQQNISL